MALERLDKILSSQGYGSRKQVSQMIRQGAVAVDGVAEKKSDRKVDAELCSITVHGSPVFVKHHLYIMMNKPSGVLSAARDSRTPTVLDILPEHLKRKGLFPAGRLDKDTTGFLLITDDGDLAHRMLAPKSHIFKLYEARLDIPLEDEDIRAFAEGIPLRDFTCLPASLERAGEEDGFPLARVQVREGKFHQVKRMFAARGKTVLALRRIRMGSLWLDESLEPGGARELTEEELALIFS
jgi:16S rRNA pseudouridine516 synthase